MAPRVALASVWHETNTFAPGRTSLDDFRAHRYASGSEAVIASLGGTGTELGGALETIKTVFPY